MYKHVYRHAWRHELQHRWKATTARRLLAESGSKKSTGHVYAHALTLAYARQARAAELAQTLDVLAPRVGGAEARLDELQRSVAAATERADEAKAALSKHGTFEQEQRQVRTSGIADGMSVALDSNTTGPRPRALPTVRSRNPRVRARVCAAWT